MRSERDFAVVLASASPRRSELLRAAGIAFEVAPAHIDESPRPGEEPSTYARRLALEKAQATAAMRRDGRPVVGADTIVVVDGEVLGKPASNDDARAMLRRLSGRTHEVITAVAVVPPAGTPLVEQVATRVHFSEISAAEIDAYVATGEPMDKAGAYAIQGQASRFVQWIEGCYFNVVGLPVPTLYRMLKQIRIGSLSH